MKQIINLGLLLACMISSFLPLKANNPYINALRFNGDISSVKIYHQFWSTKFGEPELEGKSLNSILYYDEQHRLLYSDNPGNSPDYYFYEYTYKDGILTTVDCYAHTKNHVDTIGGLAFKIKLIKEKGITVGHLYFPSGEENCRYSPYNEIENLWVGYFNSLRDGFWEPSTSDDRGLYDYIFAFEIKPSSRKSVNGSGYTYKFNSKKQLSSMKKNSKYIKFDYDDKGNIILIEIHEYYGSNEDRGSIYTFEYEYGDFETSEKFRKENYINLIKQEKARQDSIENAKQKAIEDSIANAKKQAEIAAKQAELAAKQAKEQKFEQQKEFVNAFEKAVYHKDLKILREGVTYTTSYGGRFFIVFDEDDFKTEISTDPAFASYLTYGDYRICYDDKLTCALFLSNTGKRYLIRKMADGTFKVYEIKENNSKKQKPKKNWSKYLKGLAL